MAEDIPAHKTTVFVREGGSHTIDPHPDDRAATEEIVEDDRAATEESVEETENGG